MRIIIQDAKHLKLKQDMLWIGTTTLVTVVVWVGFAIYTAFNQTKVDTSVSKLLTPLNPSLDQEALAILDKQVNLPTEFSVLVITKDRPSINVLPPSSSSPSASSGQ